MSRVQAPEPKVAPAAPLLSIEAAQAALLCAVAPLESEEVALEQAHGRVLAADLRADRDQPAFARAMMDGLAVRSVDCGESGAVLTAVGVAPAGRPWDGRVAPGTCVRIMTGAVVPCGADAVVPVERVQLLEGPPASPGGRWRLNVAVAPGRHVGERGSEIRAGEVVVLAGSVLGGARLGVAASFGHARVPVARRPRVALVPTGDEVVPVSRRPLPGQVRDSNRHAIAAVLRQGGAEVVDMAVAADRRGALASILGRAAEQSDVVVTSGGVSMGDFDLVAGALSDAGAEPIFHRVALKPGKPLLAARLGHAIVLGLPGNPVSSYVCAQLFARPLLAALQGVSSPHWLQLSVPLAGEMPATGARAEVHAGRLVPGAGGVAVEPVRTAASADMAGFARGGVMLRRPPHAPPAVAGEPVALLMWPSAV